MMHYFITINCLLYPLFFLHKRNENNDILSLMQSCFKYMEKRLVFNHAPVFLLLKLCLKFRSSFRCFIHVQFYRIKFTSNQINPNDNKNSLLISLLEFLEFNLTFTCVCYYKVRKRKELMSIM